MEIAVAIVIALGFAYAVGFHNGGGYQRRRFENDRELWVTETLGLIADLGILTDILDKAPTSPDSHEETAAWLKARDAALREVRHLPRVGTLD